MTANFQVAFGKSLPLFISVYVCSFHHRTHKHTYTHTHFIQSNVHSLVWLTSLHGTSYFDEERKENTWDTHTHTLTIFFFSSLESKAARRILAQSIYYKRWNDMSRTKAKPQEISQNIANPSTTKTCSIWCYALTHNSLNGYGPIFYCAPFFPSSFSSVQMA